jgi:DNA-binding IclR family transcriptional regulator
VAYRLRPTLGVKARPGGPILIRLGKRRGWEQYRWRTMSASVSTASCASTTASASEPAHDARASQSASHRTSRSLICGLALLRQFTAEQPERGITELARELRVSRSTAHRYASTCLELGYLEQGRRRRYRLARRCAQPGMAVLGTLQLSGAGEGILRDLREDTGRTVGLAVLDGTDVLYLRRLCGFQRGEYLLERGWGAGSRRPARETAAGRTLLGAIGEIEARPPEQRPRMVLGSGLTVDDGALVGQARGLALAVGVGGAAERTSAIELTVPAESMSGAELVATLGEPLRAAAAALQAALGGDCTEECVAGIAG